MTMASTKMKKRQRLSPSSSTSSLSSISSTSSSSTVTAAAAAAASSSPCSPSSSTSTSCSSSSPCCSCNAAINNHTPPPVAESHELELQVELEVEVDALPKSKRRKRTRSTKANAAAADRRIKKESKNKNDGEEEEKSIGTGGGSSLPLPPHPPGRRSSAFRGVTRHRWTGRFEAHLWDKSSWNNMHNKKGRQGAYDDEEAAARTYDLAALKYWGPGTTLNFPVEGYEKEMEEMGKVTKEEYLASLRRRSSGFSRGVSKYRGVARHHHNGRWEARIGRVLGNKYLYLGTFNTQEEAAEAYDLAALEYRGANAVTNFDVANYVDRLKAKGLNVDQFIHPSPPPTTAPELEIDAVDAVQPPPASPSPPPPLPSLDEEEKVAAMMMMMMPPPPPPRGDSDSMIAIEELLDFEHDDGMSGWSMCLDYPENAAVATAGCAGLPELFDDAGGFQLDDIDYLVFDAEFLDGDGGGKDVVNDKKPLSDDDGSTTTSVSCN
ncbi:unnamed protein product [Linum tenue]|uniref:AP2/ERF domain-containing protein n=1 Tax=Linum tenue TaxID=586396 RepID=A0AAV0JMA7_9ROSI|nr:unnamed protein product [Linum tenue]